MPVRQQKLITILDAKAATGIGKVIVCSDHVNIIIAIASASSGSMTIKCKGSIGNVKPDFTAAASPSNMWSTIQLVDLADGVAVNGDDGMVLPGTDDVRLFEVNTNDLDYLTLDITAWAAGAATAVARLCDNA